MTDGPDGTALADLARDWLTIWQSELRAAGTDRERAETWTRACAAWGQAGEAWLAAIPAQADGPAGQPAAQPSSGSPPADAAPDARDAAIGRLVRRIDELERRLAGLERAAHGAGLECAAHGAGLEPPADG